MTLDEIKAAAATPGNAWEHPLDAESIDPKTIRAAWTRPDGSVTSFVARSTRPGRRWLRFIFKCNPQPPERWWKTAYKTMREALA